MLLSMRQVFKVLSLLPFCHLNRKTSRSVGLGMCKRGKDGGGRTNLVGISC